MLRPTNSFAADAVLVGDPGRALLLAQELQEQPKMCNHARGLWGYYGRTPAGAELTIQSTGIGGPSAALVLADLAELGVERVVRVGSCAAPDRAGGLILVERAIATAGSATAFATEPGNAVEPDRALTDGLAEVLGDGVHRGTVASFDSPPHLDDLPPGVDAADMQTVAVLARSHALGIAAAAVLIVIEGTDGETIDDELRDESAKRAGVAAATLLQAYA
jgi:uridine phosphorylase